MLLFLEFRVATYKYFIDTGSETLYKADPYATFAEERPGTSSKVYDIDGYQWNDHDWQYSKGKVYDKPMAIYELHLGSWRRRYGQFVKYNEIVDELIKHIKEQNFTHVELMPVYEHPLDDSWGYQGTGYFAATSRFGVPKDLMYMIDRLHQENIGVLLDCTQAIFAETHMDYISLMVHHYLNMMKNGKEKIKFGDS